MTLYTILSNLVIMVISAIKFGMVATTVVAANLGIPGTVFNMIGGIAGVFVFAQFSSIVQDWLIRTFPKKFNKRFSKRTRFLARVKGSFGLKGIAFITPIILSIPVGVFFAMDLTTDKKKVITYMLAACFFWAAVFYVPYYVFEIDIVSWVKSFF